MKSSCIKPFIVVESLIYLTFIVLDIRKFDSSYVKYTGIIICFLFSLYNRNYLIGLAQFLTLIADYFLLLNNYAVIAGVIVFLSVQLVYMYFLIRKGCKPFYILRLLCLISVIIILFTGSFTLLYLFAIVYFSNLVLNTASSYTNRNLLIMSLGFTLFIGCDICVGLHNVLYNGFIYELATMSMWIFYLPSQVLLSIGGLENVKC